MGTTRQVGGRSWTCPAVEVDLVLQGCRPSSWSLSSPPRSCYTCLRLGRWGQGGGGGWQPRCPCLAGDGGNPGGRAPPPSRARSGGGRVATCPDLDSTPRDHRRSGQSRQHRPPQVPLSASRPAAAGRCCEDQAPASSSSKRRDLLPDLDSHNPLPRLPVLSPPSPAIVYISLFLDKLSTLQLHIKPFPLPKNVT